MKGKGQMKAERWRGSGQSVCVLMLQSGAARGHPLDERKEESGLPSLPSV